MLKYKIGNWDIWKSTTVETNYVIKLRYMQFSRDKFKDVKE